MIGRFIDARAVAVALVTLSLVACVNQATQGPVYPSIGTNSPTATTQTPPPPQFASATQGVPGTQPASAGPPNTQPASASQNTPSSQTAPTQQQASSSSSPSAAAAYTLALLNQYRAQAGVQPLALDATLNNFAAAGDSALAAGGSWHGHFIADGQSLLDSGSFCSDAENQGTYEGGDENTMINEILSGMMAEGPGGGHYENILNPDSTSVGISLLLDNTGTLWLTNDFGGGCS